MPFQSEKQRRYLWANEPEIARDWTDTYGSRIRKDDGGIMQGGVQNFLGQQPTVNAPKYWQSAPGHEMTELAYITPRERDTLVDMDMYGTMRGGPNEGPSGIMSLNGWGSTDPSQERAGTDMPDSSSGQGWDAPTFQPSGGPSYSTAKSPAELKLLSERKGGDTVLSSGMRNQLGMAAAQRPRGFNPLKYIGGFFGNVGRGISGLMGMGKDWAGKMRGGINPKTGRYYTQQEYEDEKSERIRNKRIQNILGRKAPITDMTQSNLRKLGYTGEMPDVGRSPEMMNMSNLGLYNERIGQPIGPGERIGEYWRGDQGITGTQAYEDFSPNVALSKRYPAGFSDEMTDDVALSKLRAGSDIDVMKGSVLDKKPFDWSMFNPFGGSAHADIMTREDLEAAGAKRSYSVTNEELDDLQKYYEGAIKAPMNFTNPASIRDYIGGKGKNIYGINMENIPENFMSLPSDFPAESRFGEIYSGDEQLGIGQPSPYKLFGE